MRRFINEVSKMMRKTMLSLCVFFAFQILLNRADLTPSRLFDISDLRRLLPGDANYENEDLWNSPSSKFVSTQCAYSPFGRSCFP